MLLLRVIGIGIALYLGITYIDGITLPETEPWAAFLIVAFFLILADILLLPILRLLTFPISILTLGFSAVLLQVGVLYAVSFSTGLLGIESIVSAFFLALLFSLIRTLISYVPKV